MQGAMQILNNIVDTSLGELTPLFREELPSSPSAMASELQRSGAVRVPIDPVNWKQPKSDVTGGYLKSTPERLRESAHVVEDGPLRLRNLDQAEGNGMLDRKLLTEAGADRNANHGEAAAIPLATYLPDTTALTTDAHGCIPQ
jgi:hypothetical protein